jgi:hypothetical protein
MSYSIRLQRIHCIEEINEASASEEPYVLMTSVDLRSPAPGLPIPPLPNFDVFRYGIFEDMDAGEVRDGGGIPFWGPSSTPQDIEDPNRVGVIVSLLENDNSTPEQYQTFLRGVVPIALASSLGEPDQAKRMQRLTNSIRDSLNGIDLPIPFALDDDHVGTELLPLDASDLVGGGIKDKTLRIQTAEGSYELVFRIIALQPAWRFCGKCRSLFFDGEPNKGRCPTGGAHEAAGFNFALRHDGPPAPDEQGEWRFCGKCRSLFFNGDPANKGACPVGGGHEAAGFNFGLLHDTPVPPNHQSEWRFCGKCMAMFFNGEPNKGVCPRPAPSSHEAVGFTFFLPHSGPPGPNEQGEWRFCGKCKSMFFNGDPANKGRCPIGGAHEAIGLNFVLPHDRPPGPNEQGEWRFCGKCRSMFFNGDPANKGVCPTGGVHEAFGFIFVLPTSPGPNRQGEWRFCGKCMAMFFNGEPNKGVCPRPAPSSHEAVGFNFVLAHT